VKKERIAEKGKGLLKSQETDGWTMLKDDLKEMGFLGLEESRWR